MNKFLNEIYDRISAVNGKQNIMLYALCIVSGIFIEANRFSNIVQYQNVMTIAALCGGLLFCVLYFIEKNHVSKTSHRSTLSNVRDIIIISFGCAAILSAPFYLLIAASNSYFDSSLVQTQNVEVIERKLRPLGPNNQVPELCVDVKLGNDNEITPYCVDVMWDLYNASNARDRVQVGVRKGALGFAYVDSMQKASQ